MIIKIQSIEIKKPLYGNYVYIWEKVLNRAIRQKAMLEIRVPKGSAVVDPREWKKNGKRMEKIFRKPNEPMILYGGNVPIPEPEKPEKPKVEKLQTSLF